jgi:lambda family phage portal protein
MNVLDKVISTINPQAGLKRITARNKIQSLERQSSVFNGEGGYTGASSRKNAFRAWKANFGDANRDINPALPMLRVRSRDHARNNPIAVGALNTRTTSVVGTGLEYKPRIDRQALGLSPEEADALEEKMQREFKLWAESPYCDATKSQNFYGMQDLVNRSTDENGEVIALLPMKKEAGNPYSLRIQLVEADCLDNPPEHPMDDDKISGGIETDPLGAPIAYYIQTNHPYSRFAKREFKRVPAFGARTGRRNVIHVFRKKRVGQRRGVPELAPIMEILKSLSRYSEAYIQQQLVKALMTVFIETPSGDPASGPVQNTSESVATPKEEEEDRVMELGAGNIIELATGEKISSISDSGPSQNFDLFFTSILKQVGMALEIPYEVLLKHFMSSYSASRGAIIEFLKFVKARRAWLIDTFCQPVLEEFLWESVLIGRLILPGFIEDSAMRAAYCGSSWNGDAQGQLNPVAETEAFAQQVDRGWIANEDVSSQINGSDFRQNIRKISSENEFKKKYNIPEVISKVGSAPGAPTTSPVKG